MQFLFDRLQAVAAQAPGNAPWRGKVLALCGSGTGPESARSADLIEAARCLRAAHCISEDAYAYVVTWVVEHEAEARMRAVYAEQFAERFSMIERAWGLRSGWEFPEGQAPQAYRDLADEFERNLSLNICECLREAGEPLLAELCERAPADYRRRCGAGRQELLGE